MPQTRTCVKGIIPIRNALNPGAFNDAIIELSRFTIFTQVFGIPDYTESEVALFYENSERQKNKLYSSMKDCELVLRFFALRDDANIRGSMKSILDRAMETVCTQEEAESLKATYRDRLSYLYDLFDKNPFKIPSQSDGKLRTSLALYDASMVAIDSLWSLHKEIYNRKAQIIRKIEDEIKNQESYELIVGRRNTAESIRDRIKLIKGIFSSEIFA